MDDEILFTQSPSQTCLKKNYQTNIDIDSDIH